MKRIFQRFDRRLNRRIPYGERSRQKRSVGVLYAAAFGAALTTGTLVAPAHAQSVYLVGAYLISSNSTGATSSTGYQYDTNSNDGAASVSINGAGGSPKSIALTLTNGTVNNFTFLSQSTTSLIGPNAELGLFFATTATSYNPTPSGSARTPELLASVPASSSAFFVPVAGTAVNNYAYQGSSTANGLSSFTINGSTISFTGFTAANVAGTNAVSGSFSLNVTGTAAAPEPGTIALLALMGMPAVGMIMGRRKVA